MALASSEPIHIREAGEGDLPAIAAILNREIVSGVNVWHDTARSDSEMHDWLAARRRGGYATLVAKIGCGTVGYGSYGPFRPHSGYRLTVEHSIYVAPEVRRRGAGRALLAALVERAGADGFHAMVGGIESGNAASLALHAAMGFAEVGRMPEVGRKFDRWLTLVFMQRILP